MKARDRLLFATSALLYSGPLYGGLAGYGFETLPLFAALLMVWLFIVRPGDWPETRADWAVPRALAWPMLIFAVQLVVAGFCLAVGSAIGGMSALQLPMPLAGPVGISLAGILIAWLLRRRGTGAPILRVPGSGLDIGAGILDVARPEMPGRSDAQSFVEDLADMLSGLGRRAAPDEDMARLANLVEAKEMTRATFEALEAERRLKLPQLQLWARLALSERLIADLLGQGRIGRALERVLFSKDPAVVTEAALLARVRLSSHPSLADELPPAVRLRQAATARAAAAPEAARALALLADTLDPPNT